MSIVYDVDGFLEDSKAIIKFRGKTFELKDPSVKETLKNMQLLKQKENKFEKRIRKKLREDAVEEGVPEEGLDSVVEDRFSSLTQEDLFAEFVPIAMEALSMAIRNFPEEFIDTLTFKEFNYLQQVIQKAREHYVTVEGKTDGKK